MLRNTILLLAYILSSLFCFVLMLMILVLVSLYGVFSGIGPVVVLFFIGLLAFWLTAVVHELGHAVAGGLVGLWPERMTLGFIAIEREALRFRIRFNVAWFRPALAAHFRTQHPSSWQMATAIAGGPLASQLLGVLLLTGAELVNPGPEPPAHSSPPNLPAFIAPGDLLTASLCLAGLISLTLGIGTLGPGKRASGVTTDGQQLIDYFFDQPVVVQPAPPA